MATGGRPAAGVKPSRTRLAYAVAVAAALAGLALRNALTGFSGGALPFLTLYPAVFVAAWYGGLGPGLVATALTAGGASLSWAHPPDVDSGAELAHIVGLVAFVVMSVTVCVLVELLHRWRNRARRHADRQRLLAQAGAELAASLDAEAGLRTLARMIVPAFADWCSVDVVDGDGTVRRLALAHGDPAHGAIAERAAVYPPDPGARHPRTQVLRTGEAMLFSRVTPRGLSTVAADPRHLRDLHALGYRSAMIVPLTGRRGTIGALTMATSVSGRLYDRDDLVLAEDLARRAALALDNARLYAEAQDANRLKEQFLATVSHELRTPLQAILGWVHVLRQGKLPPERSARALDIMERAGRAQERLIQDLLDVSRIVTGRLAVERVPVDLARVVSDVIDEIRPGAERNDVRLAATVDHEIGPIHGDAGRLRQVVANLLGNALKFTPAGGRVELRLERDGTHVRLVVKDTGAGMSPALLPHVFDAFRQASPSGRGGHGLGLGLAIVRRLVELHGGRVEAHSEGEGRGAEFIVMLPVGEAATAPVRTWTDTGAA